MSGEVLHAKTYNALFTTSTAKKKKGWKDGFVKVTSNGTGILQDDQGTELARVLKLGSQALQSGQDDLSIFEGFTCQVFDVQMEANTTADASALRPVHNSTHVPQNSWGMAQTGTAMPVTSWKAPQHSAPQHSAPQHSAVMKSAQSISKTASFPMQQPKAHICCVRTDERVLQVFKDLIFRGSAAS